MSRERILRELALLQEGGQAAELICGDRDFVIYRDVPTAGPIIGLPNATDVIVPVPPGYPASPIDLAGLPIGCPFLAKIRGGQNNQGIVEAAGTKWQLASYHPHSNGGAPPWDQLHHGFHTYFGEIVTWLNRLN